jgi:hypothetical protein
VNAFLVEGAMKFAEVPGTTPAFGFEAIDLAVLALAAPAALGLFLGLRKEQALFTALVVGAAVVLSR